MLNKLLIKLKILLIYQKKIHYNLIYQIYLIMIGNKQNLSNKLKIIKLKIITIMTIKMITKMITITIIAIAMTIQVNHHQKRNHVINITIMKIIVIVIIIIIAIKMIIKSPIAKQFYQELNIKLIIILFMI